MAPTEEQYAELKSVINAAYLRGFADGSSRAENKTYEQGVHDGYQQAIKDSQTAASSLGVESERKSDLDALLDQDIRYLGLTARPLNCLDRYGINTLRQLVGQTENDLLAITNFGYKALEEVTQKLEEHGLSLSLKPTQYSLFTEK